MIVRDNSSTTDRQVSPGVSHQRQQLAISLYLIQDRRLDLIAEIRYRPGEHSLARGAGGRAALALQLLDSSVSAGIVVATAEYGSNALFRLGLVKRHLDYAIQLTERAFRTVAAEAQAPVEQWFHHRSSPP